MLRLIGWLTALVLIALPARPASAQDPCTPIDDPDLLAAAAQSPGLTSFPVIAHYMQHAPSGQKPDGPDGFSPQKLKTFFATDGAFNKVWAAQGIRFVLVGLNTCKYKRTAFPALEGFSEKVEMPDPTSIPSMRTLFAQVGELYNAREYKVGGVTKPFLGLDLYLWVRINGAQGYALSANTSRDGAVWLDKECLGSGDRECARLFSHEAGHFFGLCHVCTLLPSEINPPTCDQHCPASAGANRTLTNCKDPGNVPATSKWSDASLMADDAGLSLADCEVEFAKKKAKAILHIN
jgi:hypothetical protein